MSEYPRCPKCHTTMMRSDLYDPEGVIPLRPNIYKDGYYWVCMSGTCEDAKSNSSSHTSRPHPSFEI